MKWMHFTNLPNRKRRMQIFVEAYGLPDTNNLVDMVIERQKQDYEFQKLFFKKWKKPPREWPSPEDLQERIKWAEQNRHLFE